MTPLPRPLSKSRTSKLNSRSLNLQSGSAMNIPLFKRYCMLFPISMRHHPQLILHSADANAGKLTLEGVISQIRNSEQYYASFGSANPHTHHMAMAARAMKAGKPTERAKPKDFDASKGDKWELSWRSTCGSCKRTGHIWQNCRTRLAKSDSPNTSANIPPSSSQSTNPSTLILGQPDIIPPFLERMGDR